MSVDLTREQWETHQKLFGDYPFFARHIQKIEPKNLKAGEEEDDPEQIRQAMLQAEALKDEDSLAGMIPFVFNPIQWRFWQFIQDMEKRRGYVRIAMSKARQVGGSTLIQGYAHYLACKMPGLKVHIISHNDDSTKKFLRRVRKMCLAAPPVVTPGRPVDNSKEIQFANGAWYGIATAGNPDALRSDNCHFQHRSERSSWKNAKETMAAVDPALSDGRPSWGFDESTSKGKGNDWHQFIQQTQAGENEFELFFAPWFENPNCQRTPPTGWQPNDEALEAQRMFKLTNAQLYWRAMKIKTLGALWMFKQEYPGTVEESFQASANTLYDPDVIMRARMNGRNGSIEVDRYAPLVLGVDPARKGDRTVLCFRQGKVVRDVIIYPKMDDNSLVRILAEYLKNGYKGTPVAKCFIDYAIGEGPASRLRDLGFGRLIVSVHFGESPVDTERYLNKRVEMAISLRDWLGDTGMECSIPDSDDVASDLLAIPDFMQSTGSEKIKLPPKDVIKKEYGKSPDIFDAMILTFAFAVQGEVPAELQAFAKENYQHLELNELAQVMHDFDRP